MILPITLPVFIMALGFAIMAWLKGRPRGWLFPSDTLFIMIVLLAGLPPLLNTYAESKMGIPLRYTEQNVSRALVGLAIMFTSFGFVWSLRPKLLRPVNGVTPPLFPRWVGNRSHLNLLFWLTVAGFVIGIASLAYEPYRNFKVQSLSFMMGGLSGVEYQHARRIAFVNDPFIGGVIGRARFSIFTFLYLCAAVYAFYRFRWKGLAILIPLFLLLGASLSKAPTFVYAAYTALAYLAVTDRIKLLAIGRFIWTMVGGLVALFVVLTLAYYNQYGQKFTSLADLPSVLSLAYYRVFVATYDGLLGFFEIYPRIFDFAGFSSFSAYAAMTGEEARVLDLELPTYLLGSAKNLTSFPTIFIGNAYASFGYLGVFVYSTLVALIAVTVDGLLVTVRSRALRIVMYSGLCVNIIYFATLAAPTALLTYGVAVITLAVVGLDRWLAPGARQVPMQPAPGAGY